MPATRLKAQVKKIIKAPFGRFNGTPEHRGTEELSQLITRLYDGIDIAGITNPAHHTSLAFDLFRDMPLPVVYVKDHGAADDGTGRFRKLLAEVEAGHSPITVRDGIQILEMANALIGNTQDHPHTDADVGWHFRIASSFAAKGRLLYNAVRFFRPQTVLEIGTAYGMSAMFMLLALERFGRDGRLWTIEPGEPQYSLAKQNLTPRFPEAVDCRYGWSHEHVTALCEAGRRFDLFFHDNGHSGEAYVNDFKRVSANLNGNAIVIYDDIRWFDRSAVSRDPKCHEGWRTVIRDPRIRMAAEIDRNIGVALVAS